MAVDEQEIILTNYELFKNKKSTYTHGIEFLYENNFY